MRMLISHINQRVVSLVGYNVTLSRVLIVGFQ